MRHYFSPGPPERQPAIEYVPRPTSPHVSLLAFHCCCCCKDTADILRLPPPPSPSHSPSPPSSSPVGKLYLTSSAASPRRHWYADGADNDIHCLRYAQSSLGSHTAVAPQPALSDKLVRVWKRTKSLHETGQELMARTGACQFENRRRYYSGVLTPTRAEWKASKRRSPSHLLMCYAAPEPLELHPVSQPVSQSSLSVRLSVCLRRL